MCTLQRIFAKRATTSSTTGHDPSEEKMAVIMQEVVGQRHGDRFYPDVSGVARSYNFYPAGTGASGGRRGESGAGAGQNDCGRRNRLDIIRPPIRKKPPPFGSVYEMLRGTQTEFWAVNMGKPPAYDPVSETEYLVHG